MIKVQCLLPTIIMENCEAVIRCASRCHFCPRQQLRTPMDMAQIYKKAWNSACVTTSGWGRSRSWHQLTSPTPPSISKWDCFVGNNQTHGRSPSFQCCCGCQPRMYSTTLLYACRFGNLNIVKYFVDKHEHSLTNVDNMGNLPLHHACVAAKPNIVSYILKMAHHWVSVQNKEKKLPLELLLWEAVCDRNSIEYVEPITCLLQADPSVIANSLSKNENVSLWDLEKALATWIKCQRHILTKSVWVKCCS